MIKISDKVVCIDGSPSSHDKNYHPNGHIEKGAIYCIESLLILKGELGFIITGKPCISKFSNINVGWRADRFRKLDDIKVENELIALRTQLHEINL